MILPSPPVIGRLVDSGTGTTWIAVNIELNDIHADDSRFEPITICDWSIRNNCSAHALTSSKSEMRGAGPPHSDHSADCLTANPKARTLRFHGDYTWLHRLNRSVRQPRGLRAGLVPSQLCRRCTPVISRSCSGIAAAAPATSFMK